MKSRKEAIEKRIKNARLKDYEVATEIGISQVTFCTWKRNLTDERFDKTNKAIDALIKKIWKGEQS